MQITYYFAKWITLQVYKKINKELKLKVCNKNLVDQTDNIQQFEQSLFSLLYLYNLK